MRGGSGCGLWCESEAGGCGWRVVKMLGGFEGGGLMEVEVAVGWLLLLIRVTVCGGRKMPHRSQVYETCDRGLEYRCR